MNAKLVALVILSLVVGAGLGFSVSSFQISALQLRVSEMESRASTLTDDCNDLNARYAQLSDGYASLSANYTSLEQSGFQKDVQILLLQEQVGNLNQSYFVLLQQFEDLRARPLQRASYVLIETQKVVIDPVPVGVRRHYTLVNIPIPEDPEQDVALVHYNSDGVLVAAPFYYWMDVDAAGKSVVSSGYFPFPCQILEYRVGEGSSEGVLYIQTTHVPTENGYVCEAGDYLAVEFLTGPKAVADVMVVYWDERL